MASGVLVEFLKMNYTLTAFNEPRGVMRIFQFVFAICAFATTVNFVANIDSTCQVQDHSRSVQIDYPFRFYEKVCPKSATPNNTEMLTISADLSSDAQFFVATGVLSMLYALFAIVVYAFLDELYRTKDEIPLADFILTVVLAIFWLSGSAAWSNGTSALKAMTNQHTIHEICPTCSISTASFSSLNISLLLGFLNFFLWTSDLWFVYKETMWWKMRTTTQTTAGGGGGVTITP